ncbi:hypothetical protein B0H14DRAFT_2592428 [Mycena olivaceomarginata]|nr:hypothetical protein B0H14DRAFT_2592428 [Mycena olivaceomarginata]
MGVIYWALTSQAAQNSTCQLVDMVVEDLCVVGSREWLFGNRLLKKLAQRLPALANSIFEQGGGAGASDEVVGHSVPSTFSITGPRDIKTDSGFGFRVIVAGMESESLSSRSGRGVDANQLDQHEEPQFKAQRRAENLVARREPVLSRERKRVRKSNDLSLCQAVISCFSDLFCRAVPFGTSEVRRAKPTDDPKVDPERTQGPHT